MNKSGTYVIIVVGLLLLSNCTQRVYFAARDGFTPDLVKYYPQTATYQNMESGLQIRPCHQQTLYKKTFPICPVSKEGVESEMICFTECECEGVPTGQVEFTLLEALPSSETCQALPLYVLGVAFGRKRTYEIEGAPPVTDMAWGYYSIFPGLQDPLNSKGNIISVTVAEIERVHQISGNAFQPELHFKKDKRPIIFRYVKEGDTWVMRSVKTYSPHFLSGEKSLVFDVSDLLGEDVIRLNKVISSAAR